ncbi:MAG TPA: universal stress protein [Ilumatobacteraceae bacterium]|nr:universal stress protein [Ilumatobacteraceae bacterium]
MTRVLIAIDGSELDNRLAETAFGLFGADAEYWAVNVQNSLDTTPVGAHPTVPSMYAGAFVGYGVAYPFTPPQPHAVGSGDDVAARREASAQEAAVSAGIDDAAVIAESGDPPTAILGAADRHSADVIVVGSHDRSWWSKLIEPSVSGDVIESSPVPVLVISEAS